MENILKNEISVYVVTHKEEEPHLLDDMYKIIHVGKSALINKNSDNTGDNISEKNPNFCELTALYWIWKNDKTSQIVGLNHYRRFFSKNLCDCINKKILMSNDVRHYLNRYDIIIPKALYLNGESIYSDYKKRHNIKDLEECRKVIEELYPSYVGAFDEVMKRKNIYPCNMFITNQEIYNNYMKWLFEILFRVEEKTDISDYDDYNKRIYGFLSERLFNVYIEKNGYNCKKMRICEVERKGGKVKSLLSAIKNDIMVGMQTRY